MMLLDQMGAARRKSSVTDLDAEGGFSFGGVLKWSGSGVSRSNLIHWTNIGIIKPDFADTAGPGYPRRFSPLNFAEVQIASHLNDFRLPTAVIRDAVYSFRYFHEMCVAIVPSRSMPGERIATLNDAQRQAVNQVLAREFIRRDERVIAFKNLKAKASTPTRALRAVQGNPLSPEEETDAIERAYRWHDFLWGSQEHFHGLFVQPSEKIEEINVGVLSDPVDLKHAIEFCSIVVNLGPIVSYTQAVTHYRM